MDEQSEKIHLRRVDAAGEAETVDPPEIKTDADAGEQPSQQLNRSSEAREAPGAMAEFENLGREEKQLSGRDLIILFAALQAVFCFVQSRMVRAPEPGEIALFLGVAIITASSIKLKRKLVEPHEGGQENGGSPDQADSRKKAGKGLPQSADSCTRKGQPTAVIKLTLLLGFMALLSVMTSYMDRWNSAIFRIAVFLGLGLMFLWLYRRLREGHPVRFSVVYYPAYLALVVVLWTAFRCLIPVGMDPTWISDSLFLLGFLLFAGCCLREEWAGPGSEEPRP